MNIETLDAFSLISGPKLIDRLNAGVKASVFARLAGAYDISSESLANALGLSSRTLRTRTQLSAVQTELTYRAYRVLVRAREVLGDDKIARTWMLTSQRAFANRTPLSMLVRDVGAQDVLNVLGAIEDGGYL